jgi:hypothetical protein
MGAKRLIAAVITAAVVGVSMAGAALAISPKQTTVVYDNFEAAGGYALANYSARWSNPYGLIDMDTTCPDGVTPANGDTRSFAAGTFHIDDAPFSCGADFSVFDHLKYIAISNAAFPVPKNGSLTFSSLISAATPGTQPGRVVHGTYGPPFFYPSGAPYAATVLQGQQAGAVMNMGQLRDRAAIRLVRLRGYRLRAHRAPTVVGDRQYVGSFVPRLGRAGQDVYADHHRGSDHARCRPFRLDHLHPGHRGW